MTSAQLADLLMGMQHKIQQWQFAFLILQGFLHLEETDADAIVQAISHAAGHLKSEEEWQRLFQRIQDMQRCSPIRRWIEQLSLAQDAICKMGCHRLVPPKVLYIDTRLTRVQVDDTWQKELREVWEQSNESSIIVQVWHVRYGEAACQLFEQFDKIEYTVP